MTVGTPVELLPPGSPLTRRAAAMQRMAPLARQMQRMAPMMRTFARLGELTRRAAANIGIRG